MRYMTILLAFHCITKLLHTELWVESILLEREREREVCAILEELVKAQLDSLNERPGAEGIWLLSHCWAGTS